MVTRQIRVVAVVEDQCGPEFRLESTYDLSRAIPDWTCLSADSAADLYYAETTTDSRVDRSLNDFTGASELIVSSKKGEAPDRLETVQTVQLTEN